MLAEDSEYQESGSDNHEEANKVSPSSLSYHTEESRESILFLDEYKDISDSETISRIGEESDNESDRLIKTEDQDTENAESSDEEQFENCVYLELGDSEYETIDSAIDKSNSLLETSSIPDSVEPDPKELKSLVESLDKTSKFPHCYVCNIVFRTSEQLNEHRSIHDHREIVTCEVCKNIIRKDFYRIHLRAHRELYNQRLEKKYQKSECTVCGKYVSKAYMKIHALQHGTAEEKAKRYKKCTICDTPIFASYLRNHMKRMHMQSKESNADKPILKIKCPICSRKFREETYKSHVASHASTGKKYICEVCGIEFASSSTFTTHSLTHKEEYKYECQFCPYRGKHLGLLKVHVRTHTKDYSYNCTTCDASFITKSNLTAHQKSHSPNIRFICSECGKCFRKQSTLRNHTVSVHEGIKAFACDICRKSYGSKVVLAAHKKRIHNVAAPSRVGRMPSYLTGAKEKVEHGSIEIARSTLFFPSKGEWVTVDHFS